MDSPPAWLMLVSSAAFWLLSSLLVGLLANQLPQRWLQHKQGRPVAGGPGGGRQQLRPWAPPGIRLWKRWIPDGGNALPGGIAKASLVRRDAAALQRLLIETRRAEWVHGLLWAAGLLTALWLPPVAVLVNLAFASAFNLPCLLLQRHNRIRLQRCIARAHRSR